MPRSDRYEIEIRGRADHRILRPLLDDFSIETTDRGTTRFIGDVRDAAHLNGLLAHFTSMNVEVVELRRLEAPSADNPSTPPTRGTDS